MWTPERDSLLESLIALDLSAAQIGAQMGVSRNSIIGRCHRRGLRVNPNSPASQRARLKLPRTPMAYRSLPSKPRPARVFIPGAVLMREPTPAGAVAFIDAQPDQCRWFQPGQEGAFGLICACKVYPEKSYCPAHYLRSVDKEFRPAVIARDPSFFCEEIAA